MNGLIKALAKNESKQLKCLTVLGTRRSGGLGAALCISKAENVHLLIGVQQNALCTLLLKTYWHCRII